MSASTTTQLSTFGQWARGYAADYGWAVLPLHSMSGDCCTCVKGGDCMTPGKHPRTSHGLHDATIDPRTIEGWWTRWPGANIGIRTGKVSGIVAVDIDPRHGGDKALANLLEEHGELPRTVTADTGGGGLHFIFKWPGEKVVSRSGILSGIDVKGDGGYIVAAPSNHVSGTSREPWTACPQRKAPTASPTR